MSREAMTLADEEGTTLELSYNQDPVCPYCGYKDEEFICDHGSWPKQTEDALESECPKCSRAYVIEGIIEINYTSYPMKEPSQSVPTDPAPAQGPTT